MWRTVRIKFQCFLLTTKPNGLPSWLAPWMLVMKLLMRIVGSRSGMVGMLRNCCMKFSDRSSISPSFPFCFFARFFGIPWGTVSPGSVCRLRLLFVSPTPGIFPFFCLRSCSYSFRLRSYSCFLISEYGER